MTAPTGQDDRLPRTLGMWSAAAVLVGVTIGSGIFRTPAAIAETLGSPGAFLLVWVIGGLVTLMGALAIAELAGMFPRSGGILAYLHEAHGPLPAFLYGWAELTVIRASAIGAISTIFAEYLGRLITLTPSEVQYVAAGLIFLIALLNWIGVGYAAVLMNITTVLKYGALLGLALFAFGAGDGNVANFTVAEATTTVGVSALFTALVSVMWAYDGWSNLSFIGGEVKDPDRNLPRALLVGVAAIVAIYLLVNAAYLYLVPVDEMAGVPLVAATAAERIPMFGAMGATIISCVVMLSTFGSTHGSVLTGPRVFFAMADRNLFFPVMARVSPRFQTPSVAIWSAAALGIAYVLQRNFAELADQFILGVWPFYILAVWGVFRLRRTRPDHHRPYRTWGYPVTPILFIVASFAMVINALVSNTRSTMITFGIIGAGFPAYLIWNWWKRRA